MLTKEKTQHSKYLADRRFTQWLASTRLVIVSYDGMAKKVKLRSLLKLWFQCRENGLQFEDVYPAASEVFCITLVETEDDPRCLSDILPNHECCPHVAVWCYGDRIPLVKNEDGVWEIEP